MVKHYAGLDVSDRLTHICIVDCEGGIVWRGACATDPEVLARTLGRHAPDLARVLLETSWASATQKDVPYDAKGNITSDGTSSFGYDAESEITIATIAELSRASARTRSSGCGGWSREAPV